jgi:hypothetical protein
MKRILKLTLISASLLALSINAYAKHHASHPSYKGEAMVSCDCDNIPPHWYVAGNLGVSHLYDKASQNSGNSVDENGPGWDATFGYQFTRMFGAELGYTQYYNSRETSASTVVAKTTHFAVHLNATARYPIFNRVDVLGKLGAAYAYAQKVFSATGAAGSNENISPYLGLGLSYELTPRTNMVGQWSFVRGNSSTGSNTLYSIGFEFAIV